MGDASDGWHTVLPTSHSGIERLGRTQLEAYEKQVLKDWESTRGHWSGIGKHTSGQDFSEAKKLHPRFKPAVDRVLGSGTYGVVEKVHYSHNNRSVCLARKWIQYRRGRTIQLLREEAHVMEKLDHHHIVKLIGSYCVRPCELYLLMWPVAVCNLDGLFNDLDSLRHNHGDSEDTLRRLAALELTDMSGIEGKRLPPQAIPGSAKSPIEYLRRIMGCIAHAVAYCHGADIRHLDLKPSNILLNPEGGVYLADFGIARDVQDRDGTMTFGLQGTPKWRAPEICDPTDEWSMKWADIYSLGLVLLNIATVVYGAELADFDGVIEDLAPRTRAEKLKIYHARLEQQALVTQQLCDHRAPSFGPKHVLGLTGRMLSSNPMARPTAEEVETELVDLGGIDQVYHGGCCRRSNRFLTERMNSRLKMAIDERDRLRAEHRLITKKHEVLAAKDETYESRIRNERKTHAEKIAKLQDQLAKERKERERLEALLAGPQHGQGRRLPRGPFPRPEGAGGSPAPVGLTMRPKPPMAMPPSPSPSPSSLQHQQKYSAAQPIKVAQGVRLTYSQTAAAGVRPVSPTSVKRPRPLERVSTDSFGEPSSPTANGSPTPNMQIGFPMRSRNSVSRLPVRTGSGFTPSRSNTPNLNRDNSLTDSTQLSMASSTFSRLSKDSDSVLGTNAMPTPAIGSPELTKDLLEKVEYQFQVTEVAEVPEMDETASVGLGLHIEDNGRRGSNAVDHTSIKDNVSVVGSVLTGTASPLMPGSVVSSPRAAKAELAIPGSHGRIPSLPTAKSWADVARKERK